MSIGYIDIIHSGQISGTTITGGSIIVSSITVNNIISTGSTNNNFGSLSAVSLSASTIQSSGLVGGGTQMVVVNNSGIFSAQSIPSAGQSTIVRNGLNTYTAGTIADYTVNISALTINTLIASGSSVFSNSLSAVTFSAGTITSGTTNLYSIFAPINSVGGGASTYVQPGLNIYTGGTSTNPTINVSALTINTLTASGNSTFSGTLSGGSSFSANTLYSGTTNLYSIFSSTGHTHQISNIDNLQSVLNTKINGSGDTVSGQLNVNILSATTLSSSTLNVSSTVNLRGSVNIPNILTVQNLNINNSSNQPQIYSFGDVSTGLNFDGNKNISLHSNNFHRIYISSGGTVAINSDPPFPTNVSLYVSGATYLTDGLSGNSINSFTSNTTYLKVNTYSGNSSNPERLLIYDVQPTSFSNVLVGIASAQTYAQLNIRNIHNGNQASSDIIATADNGSETSNYIDMGINSSTFTGSVGGINDGYLYSTGNDLWIGNITSNKVIKLFTDGTGSTNVRVTISSASTNINKLSATTVSASTLYSGTTNLYSIFSPIGSGGSGEVNTASNIGLGTGVFAQKSGFDLQFKSLSAGSNTTITSDSNTIVISSTGGVGGASTYIQPGTNTYTGGTSTNPTINVSALTINTLIASGNSTFSGTLSGGSSFSANTLYSGTTNVNNLFSTTGHTHLGGIGFTIDANGNNSISKGVKGSVIVPFNCTITSWTILSDVSGSISIDVWSDAYGSYPPTSGDTITGGEKITLTNQQKNQDLNLTSWTTSLSLGNVLTFYVESNSTLLKKVYVMINVIKLN